jgi:EmrB/QacA subfamily drug resistance transporter
VSQRGTRTPAGHAGQDGDGAGEENSAEGGGSRNDGGGSSGRWKLLAVVLLGSFMAVLDTTIVNVALPSIGQGIGANSAALEWVVSGYAVAFGLALVPAGRLGDRFGFKQMFLTGLVIFTLASAACGLAQSPVELIAGRVVQGLGAGIYFPAISAVIQRVFSGRDRSRAFGYLGGVVGVATAAGPLLGGALIALSGMSVGWRLVFFINLLFGGIAIPAAVRLIPRRSEREDHGLDPVGNLLLAAVLLLLLVPLIEGRSLGWPLWTWLCFAGFAVMVTILAAWEVRLGRREGEPVFDPQLLRRRSFTAGQLLAMFYFGGFTSLFFIISILWQEGLGRSALATGLLVIPFAAGSLLTASNSYRFSRRFGRKTMMAGISAVFAGQALMVLALHQGGPQPSAWYLVGPLALAGLGNGLVIAPNQDFVPGSVPQREAGTAGGALITAQRIGAAIGVAVIGTALFGSGSGSGGSSGKPVPQLLHTAQTATIVDLGFIAVALLCCLAMPRKLGDERAEENS